MKVLIVLTVVFAILHSGRCMLSLSDGYKVKELYFPELNGKTIEEATSALNAQMPDTCIRQLETPAPSEYYYGCVGIVVKEGIVQNPPHYMGQVPIYDDFKVFVNQPYENLIEDAKTTHLGYKFQILYQGQAVYSDKVEGEGYIEVEVDEAGNVLDRPPIWRFI